MKPLEKDELLILRYSGSIRFVHREKRLNEREHKRLQDRDECYGSDTMTKSEIEDEEDYQRSYIFYIQRTKQSELKSIQ